MTFLYRYNSFKFVSFARGDTSDMRLRPRYRKVKFFNSASAERSDIWLPRRSKDDNCFKSLKPEMSDMLHSRISSRLSAFNPFKDGSIDIDLSLPNSIHRSLGNFAKGEKSEMAVRRAFMPSKLSMPARGDTSDIGLPSRPIPFNFISPFSGDTSVIVFSSRPSQSTLIKPARGDTSAIRFPRNLMLSKRTNPANGERSDIELCRSSMRSSLMAYSSPLRLRMPLSSATSSVNLARSSSVIAAGALPSLSAITPRRLKSGIKLTDIPLSKLSSSCSSSSRMGQSLSYKQETTDAKLDVHTSRFTFPPLSSPVKPKFCKLGS